jgi:CBS domain-containing protein
MLPLSVVVVVSRILAATGRHRNLRGAPRRAGRPTATATARAVRHILRRPFFHFPLRRRPPVKIRDILSTKGSSVVTISPESPVEEAVQLLVEHDIGSVVVVSADGIRGILTERDLLRAAAMDVRRLGTARVADLMTERVVTAAPDATINDVMNVMSDLRIRHLPVVAGGELCGVISIGDVVNALRREVENENHQLHAYIKGTPL